MQGLRSIGVKTGLLGSPGSKYVCKYYYIIIIIIIIIIIVITIVSVLLAMC